MNRRLSTWEAIESMTDGEVRRLDNDYWSKIAVSCDRQSYRPLIGGRRPEPLVRGKGRPRKVAR